MDTCKKYCPLMQRTCCQGDCSWWCEWSKCCALVAIPSAIEDRMSDVVTTISR